MQTEALCTNQLGHTKLGNLGGFRLRARRKHMLSVSGCVCARGGESGVRVWGAD